MTTEEPALIVSNMEELMGNFSTPDAVWNYIDDLYKYESGDPIDPKEFFSDHNYHESVIDPLTLKCLRSPTYILSSNLRPYMANWNTTRTWGFLGAYDQQYNEVTSDMIPFNFQGPIDYYSKLNMIEYLMNLPADWYTIHMTWDNYYPEFFSRITTNCPEHIELLHSECKQIFLNKWLAGKLVYDDIIISKNWFDEVFISCKNKIGITTYYINLAWFHLMSPSLINHSLFIK